VAIGPYDILHDANGNLTRQTDRGTSNITHYVYDEENRLACVHKGTQVPPNPSCDEQGVAPLEIIYDHAGVRKRKDTSSPTFYPNQFLTDIGRPGVVREAGNRQAGGEGALGEDAGAVQARSERRPAALPGLEGASDGAAQARRRVISVAETQASLRG
jgi:YD repeat-containing protein